MRASTFLVILIFFLSNFIPSLLATPKPLLPPIDLEFVIAGLAHTETQLESGKGYFRHFPGINFSEMNWFANEEKGTHDSFLLHRKLMEYRAVIEIWFAFSGEHTHFKMVAADGTTEHIFFDGRITLYSEDAYADNSFEHGHPFGHIETPRNWGIWFKGQKWSDYLRQQKEVRITGSEAVDGIACYVLEMPYPLGGYHTLRFWIAPQGGFRLIQTVREGNSHKLSVKIDWQQYQLKTGVVWFPKQAVSLFYEDKKRPSRNEIEITDFQPNIDVSADLEFPISPETEVYDMGLRKMTTFKEIGWRPLESAAK